MPYFSNKPAPTPPNLLPTPKGAAVVKEEEKAKKRKLTGIAKRKTVSSILNGRQAVEQKHCSGFGRTQNCFITIRFITVL